MEVFSNFSSKYTSTASSASKVNSGSVVSNPSVQRDVRIQSGLQSETGENGLTKALIGLAVIGVGIAGVAIYMKKKKKLPVDAGDLKNISQNVADTTSDIQKNVKKFFDSSGDEIAEKVSLEKGKALLADGSGFSGVLKTVNGNGQEISIGYKDGFITESIIDGKLYKKFKNLRSEVIGNNTINYNRAQGVSIETFGKDGLIEKEISHLYDKNGSISRVYEKAADDYGKAIDFADGKVVARTEFGMDGVKNAKIFDKDGNVIKTITNKPMSSEYCVTDILPDGSKKERTGYLEYSRVTTPATQYDKKIHISDIVNYDPNGNIGDTIRISGDGANPEYRAELIKADHSVFSISIPKKQVLKDGDIYLPKFDFIPSDGESPCVAVINADGKNVARATFEQLEFLQKQALELMAKTKSEGIDFPYERVEKYLSQIFNA